MMQATETLMKEHQIILQRLEKLRTDLDTPLKENSAQIEEHIEFIQKFGDKFHHAKEEQIYFKWVIERNPPLEHGPIHCMLGEHDTGRGYVATAASALTEFSSGDKSKEEIVKENLHNFISLLQEHINKEDQILYPMAEQANEDSKDGDEIMMPKFEEVSANLLDSVKKFL